MAEKRVKPIIGSNAFADGRAKEELAKKSSPVISIGKIAQTAAQQPKQANTNKKSAAKTNAAPVVGKIKGAQGKSVVEIPKVNIIDTLPKPGLTRDQQSAFSDVFKNRVGKIKGSGTQQSGIERRHKEIYSESPDFLYRPNKDPQNFSTLYYSKKVSQNPKALAQFNDVYTSLGGQPAKNDLDVYSAFEPLETLKPGNKELKDNVKEYIKAGMKKGNAADIEDVIRTDIRVADSLADGAKFTFKDGTSAEVLRGSSQYKKYLVNFMDAEKQNAYYYFLGRYGEEAAEKYLNRYYKEYDNALQIGQFSKNNPKKFAQEHPIYERLARVPLGAAKAAQGASAFYKGLTGQDIDINELSAFNITNSFTEAEHENIKNPILRFANDGANMLIETSYLAPVSALTIPFSGGGAAATAGEKIFSGLISGIKSASFGFQNYGSEVNNEILNGTYGKQGSVLSPTVKSGLQALSFSFLSRGASLLSEKLLPGITGLQKFIAAEAAKVLSGAVVNATQTFLGEVADTVIRGRYSDYKQAYERYIASGMSEDESKKKAAYDTFLEPTYQSAVFGGLFAGFMGLKDSYDYAISFDGYGKKLSNDGRDPIKEGLNLGKDTEAYKNAEKLSNRRNNNKNVSDDMLGIQGMLNDIIYHNDIEYAKRLAELTGTEIRVGALDDADANGQIDGNRITISDTATEPFRELLQHETAHRVQDIAPGNFERYTDRMSGESFDAAVLQQRALYKSKGRTASEITLKGEAAADMARNFVKDINAIERVARLAERNPSMLDRAHNALKDFSAKVKTLVGKKFVDNVTGTTYSYDELRQYEKLYERAMAEAARRKNRTGAEEVRNKIETDSTGKNYVRIDEDILAGVPESEWFATVKKVLKDKFADGIEYNGKIVEVSGKSRGKFTNSDYTRNMTSAERADKFRMGNNLDEIINTQDNVRNEDPKHQRTDDITSFDRGDVTVEIGNRAFDIEMVIANKSNGSQQFYDIVNMVPTKIQHTSQMGRDNALTIDRDNNAVSGNIISQPGGGVNGENKNIRSSLRRETGATTAEGRRLEDLEKFGFAIQRELGEYTSKLPLKRNYNANAREDITEQVRQAFNLYLDRNREDGYGRLVEAGHTLRKALAKDAPDDAAFKFADHFRDLYDSAVQSRVIANQDPQSAADIETLNMSVSNYLYGLESSFNIDRKQMNEIHDSTADIIRKAFTDMQSSEAEPDARRAAAEEALRPAAETLVDRERVNNGADELIYRGRRGRERKRAVDELISNMITHFEDAQPAAEYTAKAVYDSDITKYKTDIEGAFRGINNITEGEVKRYSESVRSCIDSLVEGDASPEDIRDIIDDTVNKHSYGRGYDELEKRTIAAQMSNAVINQANEIISLRAAAARDVVNNEIIAGRSQSEAAEKAKTELRFLGRKTADIKGTYDFIKGPPTETKTLLNTFQNKAFEKFKGFLEAHAPEYMYIAQDNYGQYHAARREINSNGLELSVAELLRKEAWTGVDTVKALILECEYQSMGDEETFHALTVKHAKVNTRNGQQIQANMVAKRITPEGRVIEFEKAHARFVHKQIETLFKDPKLVQQAEDLVAKAKALDRQAETNADIALTTESEDYRRQKDRLADTRKEIIRETDAVGKIDNQLQDIEEKIEVEPTAAEKLDKNIARAEDSARNTDQGVKLLRSAGYSEEQINNILEDIPNNERVQGWANNIVNTDQGVRLLRSAGYSEEQINNILEDIPNNERVQGWANNIVNTDKGIEKLRSRGYTDIEISERLDSIPLEARADGWADVVIYNELGADYDNRYNTASGGRVKKIYSPQDLGRATESGINTLRKAGYSPERIKEILNDIPSDIRKPGWADNVINSEKGERILKTAGYNDRQIRNILDSIPLEERFKGWADSVISTDAAIRTLESFNYSDIEIDNVLGKFPMRRRTGDWIDDYILSNLDEVKQSRVGKIRGGIERLEQNANYTDAGIIYLQKSKFNDAQIKNILKEVPLSERTYGWAGRFVEKLRADNAAKREAYRQQREAFEAEKASRNHVSSEEKKIYTERADRLNAIKENHIGKLRELHKRKKQIRSDMDNAIRGYRINKDTGEIDGPLGNTSVYKELIDLGASDTALKTHLEKVYKDLGLDHVTEKSMHAFTEMLHIINEAETPEVLIDKILDMSQQRHTAVQLGDRLGLGKNKDGGHVNGKLKKELMKLYNEFEPKKDSNMTKLDILKNIATQQVHGFMDDTIRVQAGKKANTLRYALQLSAGTTWARNVLSEIFNMHAISSYLAWILDKPAQLITGKQTIGLAKPSIIGRLNEIKSGFSRGRKAFLESALDVNLLNENINRIGRIDKNRKRSFKRGPGAVLERGLGYNLAVSDEFLKGMYYEHEMRSLKDLDTFTDKEKQQIAAEMAKYRTFQNDSKLGEGLDSLKNTLNTFSVNGFGLGDFLTPYTHVPGNVVTRTIEYSPLGYLKAIYEFGQLAKSGRLAANEWAAEQKLEGREVSKAEWRNYKHKNSSAMMQRQAIYSLSRALTGTGLIFAGVWLRNLGVIIGTSDTDSYMENEFEKSKGLGDFRINLSALKRMINGEYDGAAPHADDYAIDMGWMVPVNTTISTGAAFFDRLGENGIERVSKDFWGSFFRTGVDFSLEQFKDLSLYSSVYSAINNWKNTDGVAEFATAEAADLILSFMPSLVNQVGNSLDDHSRNPYKEKTLAELFLGKLKSKIPIVREGQPLRIDLWGEAQLSTTGNKALDFVSNMISPSKISKYRPNALTEELDRLLKQSTDILPRSPYRSYDFTLNGQKYKFELNGTDYQDFANILGQISYKAMYEFMMSEDYKLLSDGDRIDTLKDISWKASNTTRDLWAGKQSGADDKELLNKADEFIKSYADKASNMILAAQATEYIQQDGVNVEDVIDAGYYTDWAPGEKEAKAAHYQEMIQKVNSGKFYDSEKKSKSSSWTQAERDERVKEYQSKIRSLDKGKWYSIEGAFNELSDHDKNVVLNKISYNPDQVYLPDEIKNNKPDMSGQAQKVIDLTDPINGADGKTALVDLGFRTQEYDKQRAAQKPEPEAEEPPVEIPPVSDSSTKKKSKWKRYSRRRYRYRGRRRRGYGGYGYRKNTERRVGTVFGSAFKNPFGDPFGSSPFSNPFRPTERRVGKIKGARA